MDCHRRHGGRFRSHIDARLQRVSGTGLALVYALTLLLGLPAGALVVNVRSACGGRRSSPASAATLTRLRARNRRLAVRTSRRSSH